MNFGPQIRTYSNRKFNTSVTSASKTCVEVNAPESSEPTNPHLTKVKQEEGRGDNLAENDGVLFSDVINEFRPRVKSRRKRLLRKKTTPKQEVACKVCSKTFTRLSLLEKHEERLHRPSQQVSSEHLFLPIVSSPLQYCNPYNAINCVSAGSTPLQDTNVVVVAHHQHRTASSRRPRTCSLRLLRLPHELPLAPHV